MSRFYRMTVTVRGHKPERIGDICGALQAQWDFDPGEFPVRANPGACTLEVSGEDYLYAGMSEGEMARRLASAVWAANGAYCTVIVDSAYLDAAPPSEAHHFDEGDYGAWLEEGAEGDEQDNRVSSVA